MRWVVIATAAAIGCGGSQSSDLGGAPDGGDDGGGGDATMVSDDGGDDGGGPLTADRACADLARAICGNYAACLPTVVVEVFGDVPTCLARLTPPCLLAMHAPASGATPSNVEACAQSRAALACDDLGSNQLGAACAILGTQPQGAACGSSWQCAGANSYCTGNGGFYLQTCGVCSTRSAAGGPCPSAGNDQGCQSGLRCIGTGAAAACTLTVPEGGKCDATHACEADLHYCDSTGTCAAYAPLGQPCDPTGAGARCSPVLGRCDSSTKVCTPTPFVPAGGACGGGTASCAAGQACPQSLDGGPPTCPAPLADGAKCGTAAAGGNCIYPATCPMGTCSVLDPATCK
jgi:hypothetical protein